MGVTGFIGRNGLAGWAILNPSVALAEHRLMREHRKRECRCAVCGTKNDLQVHHNVALWDNPDQAATDPLGRFTTLCRQCHLRWAHDFDYGHKYVKNISIISACMREIQRSEEVIRRDTHEVLVCTSDGRRDGVVGQDEGNGLDPDPGSGPS